MENAIKLFSSFKDLRMRDLGNLRFGNLGPRARKSGNEENVPHTSKLEAELLLLPIEVTFKDSRIIPQWTTQMARHLEMR